MNLRCRQRHLPRPLLQSAVTSHTTTQLTCSLPACPSLIAPPPSTTTATTFCPAGHAPPAAPWLWHTRQPRHRACQPLHPQRMPPYHSHMPPPPPPPPPHRALLPYVALTPAHAHLGQCVPTFTAAEWPLYTVPCNSRLSPLPFPESVV